MEDNVKGLIRTCCIVLVISVGLSVVYSAKRPYIYLIENYYHTPSAAQERRTIRERGKHDYGVRPSGNNYNEGGPGGFYYPFAFQDINRNGEVTKYNAENNPEPLQAPPTTTGRKRNRNKLRKGGSAGGNKRREEEDSYASFTATTISPSGETLSFPIPWDWNARMEGVKSKDKKGVKGTKGEEKPKQKKEEVKQDSKESLENTEDRKFRLPRLPTLPPFPTIDFQFETLDSEAGRKSRSHNPNRSQSTASKQIQFADIISPETLSFISKLQKLNVTRLAANAEGIISLNAATQPGSDELTLHNTNPNVGAPLLSGDFLNIQSTKPLIIPKDTTNSRPSVAEIEAYHKIKNKFHKPASQPSNRDSEEDDEKTTQEEVEDDEAEDDTSAGDIEGSQQQSDEDQEIGSKSKESKEEEQQEEPEQEQDQEPAEADSKEEQEQTASKEEEQEQEQDQEQEQEQNGTKEEQVQSDEEVLDPSDEEIVHDSPSTRTKKKTKRPIPVRRPSDSYALASLPQSLQSYSYTRQKPNNTQHYQHDNLFESANIQPDSNEQSAKPVIILVNVPKPTGLKGDTGLYEDREYLYGDEDKKAEKKAKKAEKKKKIKEKKKKKKEKKKKKKEKKKKGWPKKKKMKKKGWPPTTTQRPNKKADIINRLTKVHSNVQEIFQTFKGVISDYVINRPHVGVEFIHTNRGQPPPHRRPPPPKAEEDDDDDEEDWKKEKSGETDGEDKEKSGETDGDEHEHDRDREKSDDRKLRLPGSFEEFVEDNRYVAVGGKPTLWNPSSWSFNYPPSSSDSESQAAASLSKRLQECQKNGRLADCASYVVDRPVKYQPPEPIYVESVVSSESGEKPPRPPFREPPPRITTGSSEKVWVKTWDKEHTGLPLPIDSTELNKNG